MKDLYSLAVSIFNGETDPTADMLVRLLNVASEQYVNCGESFLSDAEYDTLQNILESVDPKNIFLTKVGSDVRGGKVDLPYQLGSLDQVYSDDTMKWVLANGWQDEDFVITDKQDGISALNIHNRNGLSISYSRGNGYQGADITRHMRRIKSAPIDATQLVAVRCEVIMEESVFQSQKSAAESSGERVYSNSRNYVAGKMNAAESPNIFYDTVKVIGTSVVDPKLSKIGQLELMASMGYAVTHHIVVKGSWLTDANLTAYLNERREKSVTPIDGIVIDINDNSIRSKLRRSSTSLNPMYSKKFKMGADDNVSKATVVKVHWNPSKSGYLKPRVEIEPVELAGVTITYATGFNAKFIADNLIGPGAIIQITRSGDVIPFIQKVLTPADTWQRPSDLFGELYWTEGNVDLVMAQADHPSIKIEIINSFFEGIDAPHIRSGNVVKLFDAGYHSPASIIRAMKTELQYVLGESAGDKIWEGIQTKLNDIPLGVLAGSSELMGRGIGKRKMTKLIEAIGEEPILTERIDTALRERIANVDGFGALNAATIVDNLQKFRDFLEEIAGEYTLAKPKGVVMGDLNDLVVVFTGIRDKYLEDKIESRGGKIGSSVSKTTTHLVAKDPSGNSSKLKKAAELIGSDNIISIDAARILWG